MLEKETYEEHSVIAVCRDSADCGEELSRVSAETAEETLGIEIPDTKETVSVRVIRDEDKTVRELLEDLSDNEEVLWAEPDCITETFGEERIETVPLKETAVHHEEEPVEIPEGLSRSLSQTLWISFYNSLCDLIIPLDEYTFPESILLIFPKTYIVFYKAVSLFEYFPSRILFRTDTLNIALLS